MVRFSSEIKFITEVFSINNGDTKLSEEIKNKIIDMLIEVIHGEHSDTRHLAVVQLVLLGNKSVNPLLTFLEKEEKVHFDLESKSIQKGAYSDDPQHCSSWVDFKKKWGHFPDDYAAGSFADSRKNGIQASLKALDLLGVENAINGFPILAAWLQGKTDFSQGWT